MANNEAAIEHFREYMSRVYKQIPINEMDFLYLCKEAVDLVKLEWQDREIIATRITSIWQNHSNELPKRSNYIGNLFSDLNLPDGQVEAWADGKTVQQLWTELDDVIMYTIHQIDTP